MWLTPTPTPRTTVRGDLVAADGDTKPRLQIAQGQAAPDPKMTKPRAARRLALPARRFREELEATSKVNIDLDPRGSTCYLGQPILPPPGRWGLWWWFRV